MAKRKKSIIMTALILVIVIVAAVTVVFSQSISAKSSVDQAAADVDFDVSFLDSLKQLAESDDEGLLTASPDGSFIAYSSDLEEKLRFTTPHQSEVHSVAVSPNKDLIVSGDKKGRVYVWNLGDGSMKELKAAHKDDVKDIAFSPDGLYIATASKDRTIKIWDAKTLAEVSVLRGHKSYVTSIDFSPTGNLLASVGVDNLLVVWDYLSGKKVKEKGNSHFRAVNQVKFSHDGKYLYTGSADTMIKVWDAEKLESIKTIKGQVNEVLSLSLSLDDKIVLSAGRDKALYYFDSQTGEKIAGLDLENNVYASGIELSKDGSKIFLGDKSGDITCIDFVNRKILKKINAEPVTALTLF